MDGCGATRRALVNVRFTLKNRCGIVRAAWIAALGALGLGVGTGLLVREAILDPMEKRKEEKFQKDIDKRHDIKRRLEAGKLTTEQKAIFDPAERSIPPVMITRVIPIAATPTMTDC